MTQQLAVYEHAREALAAAVRFDEVTQLHTDAQKAQAYARIAKDRKLQADAAEIVARAERKLGILLRKAKGDGLLSQGGRPAENSNLSEPETGADAEPVFDQTAAGGAPEGKPFTLAEIGIDKKLSARAQKLAELDEGDFEMAVQGQREKILAADALIVSPPKPKAVKPVAPASADPVKALEPGKWHRFSFSVLALSMASDRVSSEAIHKLAQFCGVVELDGDTVDFTREAIEAMGSLATVALKAIDGEEQNTPEGSGTAREASGGQPLAEQAGPVHKQGDIGGLEQGTQSAPQPLSTELADAVIRTGYARGASVAELATAIGRPGNKAYVRNRARVMGISSRENQKAAASAFATAQHAARRAGEP